MSNFLGETLPVPEATVDWVFLLLLASCLWFFFLAALSWISGFRDFLRVFTRHPTINGKTYHLTSLWCSHGSLAVLYPFCFKVTVGPEGLYIDPYFFVRPFHRPMRIGWRSVIGCEKKFFCYKFRFVELPVCLTIIGRVGRAAHDKLRQYAGRT